MFDYNYFKDHLVFVDNYSYSPKTREMSYLLKSGDKELIKEACVAMADAFKMSPLKKGPGKESFFVPVPASDGTTGANRIICEILKEETKIEIKDLLGCNPRQPLHQQKKDGVFVPANTPEFFLKGEAGKDCRYVLVDNMVSTSSTFWGCQKCLPGSTMLVYGAASRGLEHFYNLREFPPATMIIKEDFSSKILGGEWLNGDKDQSEFIKRLPLDTLALDNMNRYEISQEKFNKWVAAVKSFMFQEPETRARFLAGIDGLKGEEVLKKTVSTFGPAEPRTNLFVVSDDPCWKNKTLFLDSAGEAVLKEKGIAKIKNYSLLNLSIKKEDLAVFAPQPAAAAKVLSFKPDAISR
jgi:hypothetical protein